MDSSETFYERKIQLAGGTTYTVSLPKKWASEHDLEAGTTVRVDPHADGSLLVQTNGHGAAGADPLTLAVDDATPEALRRQIRAAYRTGRDAVTLTSEEGFSAAQRTAIRSAVQDLLGVDVVEQSETRIRCKSLLDTADVSVEQSLHQLQYVALSALRDAVAALRDEHDDPRGIDERGIDDREAEAARLLALLSRQFERALVDPGELDDLAVTRSLLCDYYTVARQLVRVATHATAIASVARGRDEPLPEAAVAAIESAVDDVCDLVERATTAVLDGADAEAACDLLADADDLTAGALSADALERTLADEPPDTGPSGELAHVAYALAATADCGGAIADVALRAAVRVE